MGDVRCVSRYGIAICVLKHLRGMCGPVWVDRWRCMRLFFLWMCSLLRAHTSKCPVIPQHSKRVVRSNSRLGLSSAFVGMPRRSKGHAAPPETVALLECGCHLQAWFGLAGGQAWFACCMNPDLANTPQRGTRSLAPSVDRTLTSSPAHPLNRSIDQSLAYLEHSVL